MQWKLTSLLQIRRWTFARIKFNAATVCGGEPLFPQDPALFRELFDGLLAGLPWCDCIYFNSLPVDSFTCRYLYSPEGRAGQYFVHPRVMKPRTWLYLEPGGSFADFLGSKQKRTRNTLKRRVKKLREHGGGALECTRIEDEDQVDSFYESALKVAEKSWQFTGLGRAIEETALYRESLINLARMGCLRAYLLSCGGQPCAFVIGYQHEDVLQFEQTAYDGDLGVFSPGTVSTIS